MAVRLVVRLCWMNRSLPMRITSAASHIGSTSVVTKSLAAVRSRRPPGRSFVVVVVLAGAAGQAGTGGPGSTLKSGSCSKYSSMRASRRDTYSSGSGSELGGGHDLVADGQQDVAGGMQVIMESLRKSGVPMAWFHCSGVGRSIDDAAVPRIFTRFRGTVAASHAGVGGTQAPHAAHLGVKPAPSEVAASLRRDDGVVAAADDDALQRIPVVPRADDLAITCAPIS